MTFQPQDIQAALTSAQDQLRGPGGAIAIVHNGDTIAKKAYGFADIDRRIPMTSKTHLPICSISKQMVCLVLVDLTKRPTPAMLRSGIPPWNQFAAELERMVPQLIKGHSTKLTLAHLYNMQSGIRDYWAMTTLWGARPDDPFSLDADATKALERTRSFHFEPGTEYSYSSVNFHVLARVIENVSGQGLGQLLSERVFIPAGMSQASLCPNTIGHPLPCVGYEGNEEHGYVSATNHIEWSGDAGIVATLEDMIAYEKYLDRSSDDPTSLYHKTSQQQHYADSTPARYGFGLGRGESAGEVVLGHGGALRGFRLHRVHMPSKRLSVVVMLNHEVDAAGVADSIIKRLLRFEQPEHISVQPEPGYFGNFLDHETRLLITSKPGDAGEVLISYDRADAKVKLIKPNRVISRAMDIEFAQDTITIWRWNEARTLVGRRLQHSSEPPATREYVGEYYSADADSTFHCTGEGTLMYGYFDGYLGKGPVHLLRYVGEDIWLMACPRGLDAPAPGDWTILFSRNDHGEVVGVKIGCWLARNVEYVRKAS